MTTHTSRFSIAMLLWLQPDGAQALAEFRSQAAPLFKAYGLTIERQIKITGKGQIVGVNGFEQPHLVQLISFESEERFRAYIADPRYQALAKQRDQGIRRMTLVAGTPLDVSDISTPGQGAPEQRLYGVGLVRFHPGGREGMDAFNLRAQALFARHGMHVESMLEVQRVLTPVGEGLGMQPERVVIFFLDDAAALKPYASDPEYLALAPLRDAGLATYDFFVGGAILS